MARPWGLLLSLGLLLAIGLLSVHAVSGSSEGAGDELDAGDAIDGAVSSRTHQMLDAEEAAMDDEEDFDSEPEYGPEDEDSEDEESGVSREALADEISFFRSQDTDGDNALTLEEYTNAMSAVNEDSRKLSEEEGGEPAPVTDPEAIKADFEAEDTNKDGKLSLDEWLLATFHEEPQEPEEDEEDSDYEMTEEERKEHEKEAAEEFAKMDTNKDGFVTLQEMVDFVREEERLEHEKEEGGERMSDQDIQESAEEIFNDIDTNKDGKITEKELFEHLFNPNLDDQGHDEES